MKVSTFQDGERFIVVFEGIKVEEKDLIKGLLAPLSVQNIESEPMVEPIPSEPEEAPNIPVAFPDGPYVGASPMDVLMAEPKEARKAYSYICANLSGFSEELKSLCESEVKNYLRRSFASVDADEYAKKLSDKQIDMFFETYKVSIPESICKGREGIAEAINHFKN